MLCKIVFVIVLFNFTFKGINNNFDILKHSVYKSLKRSWSCEYFHPDNDSRENNVCQQSLFQAKHTFNAG